MPGSGLQTEAGRASEEEVISRASTVKAGRGGDSTSTRTLRSLCSFGGWRSNASAPSAADRQDRCGQETFVGEVDAQGYRLSSEGTRRSGIAQAAPSPICGLILSRREQSTGCEIFFPSVCRIGQSSRRRGLVGLPPTAGSLSRGRPQSSSASAGFLHNECVIVVWSCMQIAGDRTWQVVAMSSLPGVGSTLLFRERLGDNDGVRDNARLVAGRTTGTKAGVSTSRGVSTFLPIRDKLRSVHRRNGLLS